MQEARLVVRYLSDASLPFTDPVRTVSSLAFLLIVNAFQVQSLTLNAHNLQYKLIWNKRLGYQRIALLTRSLEDFEQDLSSSYASGTGSTISEIFSDVRYSVPKLFGVLRDLSSGRRVYAQLVAYDLATNQGIVVRRRFRLVPTEMEFTTPRVHQIGNLRKVTGRRQVQIDLLKVEKKEFLTNVLSKPSLYAALLPVNTNLVSEIIYLLRAHSTATAIVFPLVFIVIAIIAAIMSNFTNITIAVVSIILSPAWEILLDLILNSILPERSRDLDK